MLKRTLALATLTTTITAGAIAPAMAAPRDFVGTWVNSDTNTRGITKIVVRRAPGNKLVISTFGKCHPTDCKWGAKRLSTYGTSVQDKNHRYATTIYNKKFATTFLNIGLSGRNRLRLQSFTKFTDNSGRQNYSSRAVFVKR
ncbi:MAG: hypothetical protein ACFB02_21835 [Mastigocoleus sp.]